jgi:hypothetical protein
MSARGFPEPAMFDTTKDPSSIRMVAMLESPHGDDGYEARLLSLRALKVSLPSHQHPLLHGLGSHLSSDVEARAPASPLAAVDA